MIADLHTSFDQLVAISYRWGSPEWLELRKRVMEAGGIKGFSTRHQRRIFKFFQKTGIIWLL